MIKIIVFVIFISSVLLFSIPKDKLLHIGISSLLSSTISSVFGEYAGFFLTISIGISKEIYDIFTPGTPDIGDIAADIFGDALGVSFLSDKERGALIIWEF